MKAVTVGLEICHTLLLPPLQSPTTTLLSIHSIPMLDTIKEILNLSLCSLLCWTRNPNMNMELLLYQAWATSFFFWQQALYGIAYRKSNRTTIVHVFNKHHMYNRVLNTYYMIQIFKKKKKLLRIIVSKNSKRKTINDYQWYIKRLINFSKNLYGTQKKHKKPQIAHVSFKSIIDVA